MENYSLDYSLMPPHPPTHSFVRNKSTKTAGKQVHLVDLEATVDEQGVRRRLDEQRVTILNIAGSREGQYSGIYRQVFAL